MYTDITVKLRYKGQWYFMLRWRLKHDNEFLWILYLLAILKSGFASGFHVV